MIRILKSTYSDNDMIFLEEVLEKGLLEKMGNCNHLCDMCRVSTACKDLMCALGWLKEQTWKNAKYNI